MQSISLEYDTREEMAKAADFLLKKTGVTGEVEMKPLEGNKWLLKVHSEKDLRESTIEKLGGRRID